MSTITTKDGTEIYYKDWGEGPVVTSSHGWPLNADAWDGQMLFLSSPSTATASSPTTGAATPVQPGLIRERHERLRRRPRSRDRGPRPARHHPDRPLHRRQRSRPPDRRHGTGRVAKAVLLAAVPPIMLKFKANPEGLPPEVFDGLRAGLVKDPSQFYKDLAIQFYGANRPGAEVSQGGSWISSGCGACSPA